MNHSFYEVFFIWLIPFFIDLSVLLYFVKVANDSTKLKALEVANGSKTRK